MELEITYKSGSEDISVELRGDFDHMNAESLVKAVIEGSEPEPEIAVVGDPDWREQYELAQKVLGERRPGYAGAKFSWVVNDLISSADGLLEDRDRVEQEAMKSEQAATHYQNELKSVGAVLQDYESMAKRRDALEAENRSLREKLALVDGVGESITMISHPAAESDGDDRVAVIPVLPNGGLVDAVKWATVVAEGWDKDRDWKAGDLEAPAGYTMEQWEAWMRNLQAALDKVWEIKGEAGWSHVTWIRASALAEAPEDVRAWISGLASS